MTGTDTIAEVTRALGEAIQSAMSGPIPGARLTTLNPASEVLLSGDPIVNVFLYRASPVAAVQTSPGATDAMELDYLISFFGDDRTLEPQKLLGAVVDSLHASPVIGSGATIAQRLLAPLELVQLWADITGLPYALSICCTVRPAAFA